MRIRASPIPEIGFTSSDRIAAKSSPGQRTTVPSHASRRRVVGFRRGRSAASSPSNDSVRIPRPPPCPRQGGPILPATQEAVKTSVADQGPHEPGRPIRDGDPGVVGVRNVQAVRAGTDTAGLAEGRRRSATIRPARAAAAEPGGDGASPRLQPLDLVVVAVGQKERAVATGYPERMLKTDSVALAILVTEDEEVLTDEGGDLPGLQVDVAHGADLGIRDIQVAVVNRKSTRLGEPSLRFRSIEQALTTGAGEGRDRAAIEVERPDLVGSGHRDVQDAIRQRQVPGRA